MNIKTHGTKGFKTEELIRKYFLQAGFFVVRGPRLKFGATELTNVDLWVYERSATLARRRTVIDIKDKQRPQAAERLFFIQGLGEIIGVEGVGVVTTDKNKHLRSLARKNKVLWIDGDDLQRLKSSNKLAQGERFSDEEFLAIVADVDRARGGRIYRDMIDDMKSAVVDRFGASSANLSLDVFHALTEAAIKSHPGSEPAKALTRISFLAASLVAVALDFASADSALRPLSERRKHMSNSIRFGEDVEGTYEKLDWAARALREYVDNGSSIANQITTRFDNDVKQVPAEDLAEFVVRLSNTVALFNIARTLEHAAFSTDVVTFDALPTDSKSFVGALLDFAKIDRKKFSEASPVGTWRPSSLDNQDEEEISELIDRREQGSFKI